MNRSHRFDEMFSKNERGREEWRVGTEEARKIAKESRRGLKKGSESGIEQCHEVERVKKKGDQSIPNTAEKQREQELKKGGGIPKKLTQRTTELSKSENSCDKINVQPCKDSRIIHQVIHKRNQTWFVRVFREITKQ